MSVPTRPWALHRVVVLDPAVNCSSFPSNSASLRSFQHLIHVWNALVEAGFGRTNTSGTVILFRGSPKFIENQS